MTAPVPWLTVIVPTRDRQASLLRTVAALRRQDLPSATFEIVVVDDGRREPVEIPAQTSGCEVRVIRTGGRGAAAARNAGAAAARGPVLVFLDDDVEAGPGLLRAHLASREAGAGVTTGYLPARPSVAEGFFATSLRNRWEATFAEMRRPGHRFSFRDVLTGNCAIAADLFHRVGGFDESLACREDYELGVRVVEHGARLAFAPDAVGIHHEVTTLDRSLDRKRAEGRSDVMIARKHPSLVPALAIASYRGPIRQERLAQRLALTRPSAAALLLVALRASLGPLEAARMRGRWLVRLDRMLRIAYWQGVASEVHTVAALEALLARRGIEACPAWWVRLDLAAGIDAAAGRIDRLRPDAVALTYANEAVGRIEPSPGGERLLGAHLRPSLARELAWPFVAALGRAGVVGLQERPRRLVPTAPLPHHSLALR